WDLGPRSLNQAPASYPRSLEQPLPAVFLRPVILAPVRVLTAAQGKIRRRVAVEAHGRYLSTDLVTCGKWRVSSPVELSSKLPELVTRGFIGRVERLLQLLL